MTERIAAVEGALRAGSQAVHAAGDDVSDTVSRIHDELERLRAAWSGAASDSYDRMMAQWQADVRRLRQTLAALEEALKATEQDQLATEQSHLMTIAGLDGMMGN